MAFEFNQTNLLKFKEEVAGEFQVSGKFETDGRDAIKSVVKTNCFSQINNSEILATSLAIVGQTNVNMVVLTLDNEIKTIKGAIEWQNKCDITEAQNASVVATTKNVETKIVGESVVVCAMVEISEKGLSETPIPCLVEGDGVLAKKETKVVKTASALSQQRFSIVEDIALEETTSGVLSVSPNVVVYDVSVADMAATISGEVFLEVAEEKDDNVVSSFKTIEFKQEVEAVGATQGAEAFANIYVENLDFVYSENDEKKQLAVTLNALCEVVCYVSSEAEITTDAYCLNNITKTVAACERTEFIKEAKTEQKQVAYSEDISDLADFDEFVCALASGPVLYNSEALENETNICGEAAISLVYKNEEGQLFNKIVNVPFNITAAETNIKTTLVALKSLAAKVRAGHEVNIELNLEATYLVNGTEFLEFVSGLEDCGEAEDDDSAIVMAACEEGEDAFSMGKKLRTRPEDIVSQNEGLSYSAGEKVFVYKHKEENFNY